MLIPLESIVVPPAALSRSKGGFDGALAPLEASGHGRRHGFWARTGSIWEQHGKHISAVGSKCSCHCMNMITGFLWHARPL